MTLALSTGAIAVLSLALTITPVLAQSISQPTDDPSQGLHLKTPTYQGCYSSSGDLVDQGEYTFQALGWCQPWCVRDNAPVLAFTAGSNCLCGSLIPALAEKVSDSNCNSPCQGFPADICKSSLIAISDTTDRLAGGGNNYYSVYLTGLNYNVGHSNAGDDPPSSASSSSSSSSSTSTAPSPSTTTTAPANTPTQNPGGATAVTVVTSVLVTKPNQTSATVVYQTEVVKNPGSSGPNKTAIAVGVVVGVFALAAIIGGALLWLRHRRKAESDAENRHGPVNPFVGPGERSEKPPSTAVSIADSRLDPSAMFARRQSNSSIADNQDYSRRILKVQYLTSVVSLCINRYQVTNPDNRG